jgi:hypothetical protein
MRILLIAAIAFLLLTMILVGLATRYEVISMAPQVYGLVARNDAYVVGVKPEMADFYLLDRWTGRIWGIKSGKWIRVTEARPASSAAVPAPSS